MRYKVKKPETVEIEIFDGYYKVERDVFSIKGDESVRVCVINDFASITTSTNEFDHLELAVEITEDEFQAELEKAFEIIRGKL